jgi:phospholipid/cholesterol/gamma-HCH transport system substrate-binding protein
MVGVGVFVIVGLLLFGIGLFMIGDRQLAFARRFTLYTEFSKITGLSPGSIVRVAGARAGSIEEIVPPNRPSDKFRVRLEVTEELHPLVRTDSVASIQTEGLVGGSFLAIGTGSPGAEQAPENSTIPSREPFEIADLLQQMSDTITKVNATIDELRGDIVRSVNAVGDTVENANDLIDAVADDVKTMASAGARISGDVAEITGKIERGEGTVGKLLNDDELYTRMTGIAKDAEAISADVRETIRRAREALASFDSKEGPLQSTTSSLKLTMEQARVAMVGLAENMEALKRNFLFRGFFNRRGYFELTSVSPAEYRQGKLLLEGDRQMVRIWLQADVIFEPGADQSPPVLTDAGKARLDSALAPYLPILANVVVVVEGYAQQGTSDEQYLRSRARAAAARDYLAGKFDLNPGTTGFMPLGADSRESPGGVRWDGVALAVFAPKGLLR